MTGMEKKITGHAGSGVPYFSALCTAISLVFLQNFQNFSENFFRAKAKKPQVSLELLSYNTNPP